MTHNQTCKKIKHTFCGFCKNLFLSHLNLSCKEGRPPYHSRMTPHKLKSNEKKNNHKS